MLLYIYDLRAGGLLDRVHYNVSSRGPTSRESAISSSENLVTSITPKGKRMIIFASYG